MRCWGEDWEEIPREGVRAFVDDELLFQAPNPQVWIRVRVDRLCLVDAEITKE